MSDYSFDPRGGSPPPNDWQSLGDWRTIKLASPKKRIPSSRGDQRRSPIRRSFAQMLIFMSLLIALISFVLIVASAK